MITSHVHGVAFVGAHIVGPIISYRRAGRADQYRTTVLLQGGAIPTPQRLVSLQQREYSMEEAQVVVDWINGQDRPLPEVRP